MKKLILKIVSFVLAFFLGLLFMGYYMMAGNNEQTDSMAKASLPLVTVVREGREYNTMHGYTGDADGRYIRGDVIPLPADRQVMLRIDPDKTDVRHVFYEVRSLDHTRLVEDAEVEFSIQDGCLWAELSLKDLLEKGQEYALILRLETKNGSEITYYTRIAELGEEHLRECLDFAEVWHEATFDKENDVSISQYLESTPGTDNDTLGTVSIHSRYKQIIWDQLKVTQYSEPALYIKEIDDSVTALQMEYTVQAEEEGKKPEYYEVKEYFRIRYTDQRMYLLDYYRTANRVFDDSGDVFSDTQLTLGILSEAPSYMKNAEENVVAFVQNGELWLYDAARNNLAYVFGFRDGWDQRSDFDQHDIRILDMDESGSMNFIVYGYMNRGIHEGRTGVSVYFYNALTNSVEEKVFLESRKPYEILREEVGRLAHVTDDQMLYIYVDGKIYVVDLETRESKLLADGLLEDCYLQSADGSIISWQEENSLYAASELRLLNLNTGMQQTISADPGEFVQGLGFMGTDFIWGAAREGDIRKDLTGNVIFPMYKISIQNADGQTVREFNYEEQGKYVVSVTVEDNRIELACVTKNADGGYASSTPEPITNKTEENREKIVMKTRSTKERKREYVLSFTDRTDVSVPKKLTPKLVLFEGSRTIPLSEENGLERYYVYGEGRLQDSYGTEREAVAAADSVMGVVMDSGQRLIWSRSGRRTRIQIDGITEREGTAAGGSLAGALEIILNFERQFPDAAYELQQYGNAYDVLRANLEEKVLDLAGCSLDEVLYYVSLGKPVLAMTSGSEAEVIIGYDPQNIIVQDPVTGKIFKRGMNDSRDYYNAAGNLFVSYLEIP